MVAEAAAPERPQFDDTRRALEFALNFRGETKASVMSRMMAQVRVAPKRPSKRAKKLIDRALADMDDDIADLARELIARQYKRPTAKSKIGAPPKALQGLDGAHMAGYTLAQFARLDTLHQTILRGVCLVAYSPCNCRAPCCSGVRRNAPWAAAVVDTCDILQHAGAVLREPGKRGLSTQPALRLALVESYYTERERSLIDLAMIGQVSTITAARHKEWICGYLEQTEDAAWTALAPIFDEAGITGAFE